MDKDLAKFCVNFALRNGANYSEARVVFSILDSFMLKKGIPTVYKFYEEKGIGIRVLVDGAMSFLSANNLDRSFLKEKIKKAIRFATISAKIKKEKIEFEGFKFTKAKWEVKAKKKIVDVSPKDKMNILFDIEKNLKDFKSKVPSRFFQLNTDANETFYTNSEGTEISSRIPRTMLHYSLVASEGNQSEQRYFQFGESGGWEVLKKWKMEEKIREEAKILLNIIRKSKPIVPEAMDVILSPELVGIAMHESCGHPYEADRILGREGAQAGESFITKEWLGTRIGSDTVTVVDDPLVPNNFGYYEYDDEGVKARRRILIKNGIINEFLHNRETAIKMNTESNAAARASAYSREPLVRMSNTFMLPGNYSFDELIEGIQKGVYIKSFTEWNIDDKRWNQKYVGCESYLIENGELKGPVRRPILEITTKAFFSAVDACGKEVDYVSGTCGKGDPMSPIPVWMGGPHIRLRNVVVGRYA
ncbi:TldD/PmbA family protein [archaeon]|nr:TldD/PmbA family protein [archaeon]